MDFTTRTLTMLNEAVQSGLTKGQAFTRLGLLSLPDILEALQREATVASGSATAEEQLCLLEARVAEYHLHYEQFLGWASPEDRQTAEDRLPPRFRALTQAIAEAKAGSRQ